MAKITKKDFETKLNISSNGNIMKVPYVENNIVSGVLKPSKMTLYYLNDRHVGTWKSGNGWIKS